MATHLISKEEKAAMRLMPFGRKHPVRILLEQMKPGQILRIGREDFLWKRKTPSYFCRQIEKSSKARFTVLKEVGKTGWVVERMV
jgi:hypothetical protein